MMPLTNLEYEFDLYEGKCQGCDNFTRVNDLALCEECNGKLDRDLIRQREWDYSASAFSVPKEKLEEFRAAVIKEYGEKYELIVPEKTIKNIQKNCTNKNGHNKHG
jgi:hypothetical protein